MTFFRKASQIIKSSIEVIKKVPEVIEDGVMLIKKHLFDKPPWAKRETKGHKQATENVKTTQNDYQTTIPKALPELQENVNVTVTEDIIELTVETSKPKRKVNPSEMEYTRVRKLTDNYVVLDFETTGFSEERDRIIQIGATKYKSHNLIDQYTTYVNPKRKISARITKITSITNDKVKNAPLIEQALPELVDFIGNSDLVAHNASFDMKFLLFNMIQIGLPYKRFRVIDTLSLARKHVRSENHKLVTLKKHFDLDQYTSHDALGDCFVTGEVYKYCYEKEVNPPLMTFKDPQHYGSYDLFTIGETLYNNKQYDEAEKYLLASVEKGNDAPAVYKRLAILYRKQKRYEDELDILLFGKIKVQNTQDDYRDEEFDNRINRVKELLRTKSVKTK